jgi:Cft2 family RNA processing exonuclease
MSAQAIADSIDIEELYEFVMALRSGDFSKQLPVPEAGRAREVAMHLNRHMQNMDEMTREITRVATEVTQGTLGPQAVVSFGGPYRTMTDSVNVLAGHVTDNIRDMIWTADALTKENRPRRVHENCTGEWKHLKSALNAIIDRAKPQPASSA